MVKYSVYDTKGKYWKSLNLTPADVRHFKRRFPRASLKKVVKKK